MRDGVSAHIDEIEDHSYSLSELRGKQIRLPRQEQYIIQYMIIWAGIGWTCLKDKLSNLRSFHSMVSTSLLSSDRRGATIPLALFDGEVIVDLMIEKRFGVEVIIEIYLYEEAFDKTFEVM